MRTAYCFNCQMARKVKNPKKLRMNNRPAVEGFCPVCGEKMFRIARPRAYQPKVFLSSIEKSGLLVFKALH